MNEILHANIFFVIASIGVVIFIILVSLVLYQVLKIVKSVRKIVDKIEAGSEVIAEDISQLRSFVLEGSLMSQLFRFFMPGGKRRRTKRTDDDDE